MATTHYQVTNQYQAGQEGTFNFGKILSKLLRYWYLIVISISIFIAIAYFVDKYTKPSYYVSALLHIKPADDKTNVSNILYGDAAYSITSNLSNEIIFLKSRSLIEKTIQDLNFDISYFKQGKFVTSELYKNSPIEVFPDTASTFIPYYVKFTCTIKDNKSFSLSTEEKSIRIPNNKLYRFDEILTIQGFSFKIQLKYKDLTPNEEVIFQLNSVSGLINQYRGSLYISSAAKESSVLKLSLEGQTPQKEIDFLNQLSINLIKTNLQEKNSISSKTVDFIDQMLNQSRDSLSTIETKLETFKGTNSVVSVQEKGSQLMEEIKQMEQEKVALLAANQYFNYLIKSLEQAEETQITVPSSLGIQDAGLNASIGEIISLQLENRMLKADKKVKNPFIELNNQKIAELKKASFDKIKSLKAVNEITLKDINGRINKYLATQKTLPSAEREFNDISRNYSISESLVQFLMEKRAVSDITRASNASDYRIVDTAHIESGPVKKTAFDYKMALLVGLLIPVAFIVIGELLNNTISSREELLKLTPLPLLGIVVHGSANKMLKEAKNHKTALAESMRSIRSNLSYISESNGSCKVILLSSSISGEGKSFCAKNLSHILAISDKKTLLINADMRKVGNYESDLGDEKGIGLSTYLSGMAALSNIIQQTSFDNLYVIHSGDLPPNPSELLLSGRMREMLEELKKQFDYIVLDTPPIGLIADGLELMKQSDINILVTRQGYTKRTFLTYINDLYLHQKYTNMVLIFNDVDLMQSDNTYGLGEYGYGYYAENKPKRRWLPKIKSLTN